MKKTSILFAVLATSLLLALPSYAQTQEDIDALVSQYKDQILQNADQDIQGLMSQYTNKDLEDLQGIQELPSMDGLVIPDIGQEVESLHEEVEELESLLFQPNETCGLYPCMLDPVSMNTNQTCIDGRIEMLKRTAENFLNPDPFDHNPPIEPYFPHCVVRGSDPEAQKMYRSYSSLIVQEPDPEHPLRVTIEPGECAAYDEDRVPDVPKVGTCYVTLKTYTLFKFGEQAGHLLHVNEASLDTFLQDPKTMIAERVIDTDSSQSISTTDKSGAESTSESSSESTSESTGSAESADSSTTNTGTVAPVEASGSGSATTDSAVTGESAQPQSDDGSDAESDSTETSAPVLFTPSKTSAPVSASESAGDFVLPPQYASVQGGWSANPDGTPSWKEKRTEENGDLPSGTETLRISTDGAVSVYSKRSGYNADGTWIIAGSKIWNAADGSDTGYFPGIGPQNEYNWSYTDPEVVFGIGNDKTSFVKRNVVTDETVVLGSWPEFKYLTMGIYEGVQSIDDSKVVIVGHKDDDAASGDRTHISFDIKNQKELGRLKSVFNDNWSGFSQDGKIIYVEGNNCCTSDSVYAMKFYDENFTHIRTIDRKPEHGDWGVDRAGNQVYVMDTGSGVNYVNPATGTVTTAVSSGLSWGHLSCRAIKRPGYCYQSSGVQGGPIVEIEVKNNGGVRLYGLPRSNGADSGYNHYPMATPDATGSKITYHSDYGSGSPFQMQMKLPKVSVN